MSDVKLTDKPQDTEDYLRANKAQLASADPSHPVFVMANAGSGKTKVLHALRVLSPERGVGGQPPAARSKLADDVLHRINQVAAVVATALGFDQAQRCVLVNRPAELAHGFCDSFRARTWVCGQDLPEFVEVRR